MPARDSTQADASGEAAEMSRPVMGRAGALALAGAPIPEPARELDRGADKPQAASPPASTSRRSPLAWCRRHALLLLLVIAGAALRIAAVGGYRPALLAEESRRWLSTSSPLRPGSEALDGYPVGLLSPLAQLTDSLRAVSLVQHLLGIAAAVAVYALLRRWAVWRWLSALAAAPLLLDSYVVAGEHLIVPDTLATVLLVLGVAVLGWRARPGVGAALAGGVLLGAAAAVRLPAEVTIAAAVAFLLVAGARWGRRAATSLLAVAGFAVPLVAALAWQYGGVAGAGWPDDTGSAPSTSASADGETALPPLVTWSRDDLAGADAWRFATYRDGGSGVPAEPRPQTDAAAGGFLESYQRAAFVPGPILLACALLALLAVAGLGRSGPSQMRAVTLLALAVPAAVLLDAVLRGDGVSSRDLLPAVALWPAAAALGLTALLRGRRAPSADRPQIDDVDRAALAEFRDQYGNVRLAPVCVVIAAYNEAPGLPRVLATMPTSVCDLPVDVVVVDDGSSDGTADAARDAGRGYLVACPTNRGQGAALRLGYRVARDFGARYVITTDADGQYDVGDFPAVLAPLLEDRADFVTGSRRLGHQHTRDRFRRAGVYVFAWIISAFTGRHLTDTSFGLRAMKAEVTGAVTLNQPQYQSSELLLGVHSHGFRIAEVPGTMHVRTAGSTKKGRNLVYGSRYARVVFGTWWREGCPTPVPESATALRNLPRSPSTGSSRAQ